LAQGKLQQRKAELARSINGYVSEHVRWLLKERFEELVRLDHKLDTLDMRIAERIESHADLVRRLCTIPGVDRISDGRARAIAICGAC
jgi:transposase